MSEVSEHLSCTLVNFTRPSVDFIGYLVKIPEIVFVVT